MCVCVWELIGVAGGNGVGAVGLGMASAKQAGVSSGAERENRVV